LIFATAFLGISQQGASKNENLKKKSIGALKKTWLQRGEGGEIANIHIPSKALVRGLIATK
jgi:hypothetical protein